MKDALFIGALIAVGLVVIGKIKPSLGVPIGIGFIVVANFIPDTSSAP